MTVVRCTNCNKILYEADLQQGTVRKICDCGTINELKVDQNKMPAGLLVRIEQPKRP